ncbi:unnamed protein product [Moneuplotes crassus]|uniref:AP2/ERF domain-containing protein n=1 Tax=Euplotes crassus TaxID=5936 RepID=A0AAD1TZN0_EUPCR|nr:unnamed protein product [Moneuplotes crassus]
MQLCIKAFRTQSDTKSDKQRRVIRGYYPCQVGCLLMLFNNKHCFCVYTDSSITISFLSCTSLRGGLSKIDFQESKSRKKSLRMAFKSPAEERAFFLKNKLGLLYQNLEILEEDAIFVKASKKLPYTAESVSKRRSKYIGVFKNCSKWQAFIAINSVKTYIQVYESEENAAKAFDVMSLILKRTSAFTNFKYTKREVVELLHDYQEIVTKFCQ